MRSETVSETPKCPYCGGEMVYQFDSSLMTNKEKIIYRGYFCCPNCHSRAPVVSELSELETIEEVEDDTHEGDFGFFFYRRISPNRGRYRVTIISG